MNKKQNKQTKKIQTCPILCFINQYLNCLSPLTHRNKMLYKTSKHKHKHKNKTAFGKLLSFAWSLNLAACTFSSAALPVNRLASEANIPPSLSNQASLPSQSTSYGSREPCSRLSIRETCFCLILEKLGNFMIGISLPQYLPSPSL